MTWSTSRTCTLGGLARPASAAGHVSRRCRSPVSSVAPGLGGSKDQYPQAQLLSETSGGEAARYRSRSVGFLTASSATAAHCTFTVALALALLASTLAAAQDRSGESRGGSHLLPLAGQKPHREDPSGPQNSGGRARALRSGKAGAAAASRPTIYRQQTLQAFPHDGGAFTQGLVYAGRDANNQDILYESTGLYGSSSVRRVVLRTGRVVTLQRNEDSVFGEGLALVRNGTLLAQVQWRRRSGFFFSPSSLQPRGTFQHGMLDGWGLAVNPANGRVYGSDGTEFLYWLNGGNFSTVQKVRVFDGNQSIFNLNELEFVGGFVLANVWQTPCIARINPRTGRVVGWIVLDDLVAQAQALGSPGQVDVLNGIAWDQAGSRLFVTGKLWPKMYHIRLLAQRPRNYAAALDRVRLKCWPTPEF